MFGDFEKQKRYVETEGGMVQKVCIHLAKSADKQAVIEEALMQDFLVIDHGNYLMLF